MFYSADQLDSVFMRKSVAAKLLGLTPWQLNQLVFRKRLELVRIAGEEHLYTSSVEALINSPTILEIQALTDPIETRKAMRQQLNGGVR